MQKKRNLVVRLRENVELMGVKNGDVLLVKKDTRAHSIINELAHALGSSGRQDCIIVVVDEFTDLRRVTAENMEKYGWVRKQDDQD